MTHSQINPVKNFLPWLEIFTSKKFLVEVCFSCRPWWLKYILSIEKKQWISYSWFGEARTLNYHCFQILKSYSMLRSFFFSIVQKKVGQFPRVHEVIVLTIIDMKYYFILTNYELEIFKFFPQNYIWLMSAINNFT